MMFPPDSSPRGGAGKGWDINYSPWQCQLCQAVSDCVVYREGRHILSDDIDVDRREERLTVVTSKERERLPARHCLQLPVRDGRDGETGHTQHPGGDQEGQGQGEGAEGEEEGERGE